MFDDDEDISIKFRNKVNKSGVFIGILFIIFALGWIAAKLGLIPEVLFSMWPQILIIIIGIYILYKSL